MKKGTSSKMLRLLRSIWVILLCSRKMTNRNKTPRLSLVRENGIPDPYSPTRPFRSSGGRRRHSHKACPWAPGLRKSSPRVTSRSSGPISPRSIPRPPHSMPCLALIPASFKRDSRSSLSSCWTLRTWHRLSSLWTTAACLKLITFSYNLFNMTIWNDL